MKPSDPPIVIQQSFGSPVDVVWQAITDVDQMRQWFFAQIPEFAAETGFETQFDVDCEGKIYRHRWNLIEVVPQQKIVYDWRYDGCPGAGLVTWELTSNGDGTLLTLTNVIVNEFPDEDPAFRRESCEAGWQYFINEQLKDWLEPSVSHDGD